MQFQENLDDVDTDYIPSCSSDFFEFCLNKFKFFLLYYFGVNTDIYFSTRINWIFGFLGFSYFNSLRHSSFD